MKERIIELLAENGITAEMGVTPIKYAHILQTENGNEGRAFWFVETESDIDDEITNFVRHNIEEYIFACVKNDDYENGRYMLGNIQELKDYNNPDGVHEKESFMSMSFGELAEKLRPEENAGADCQCGAEAEAGGTGSDNELNGQEIYVAVRLRNGGVPLEEIAAVTGLSVSVIENL